MQSYKFRPIPFSFKSLNSFFLMLIAALILSLTGCGDDATGPDIDNGNDENGDAPPSALVQMTGRTYSPSTLEVEVGTTVRWENNSDETHTVTSGSNREHDDEFNSGDIAPGESYTYTFDNTGSFDYFCIPHPGMEATITVVEGD